MAKVGPTHASESVDAHRADFGELVEAERAASRWYRHRNFWLVVGLVVFLIWFVPFVPALFFSSITVTRLDAQGKSINVEVGPGTKQWISIAQVSRHVVNAVVVAEDAKFYQHYGFDFEAIGEALELNRKKGRYVRGASTISQQVVKIAFLSREKTIIRKIREAAGTLLLELLLSKDRILEWYINLCEFGGGIYGVKPAGVYYFKTRPELLTIEHAVNLAVVIPSPNKWSAGLRAKSLTPFGQRRFSRIVNNMFLGGYITEVQRDTALARGNFGNPISGFGQLGEDDDCRGDRECDDLGGDGRDLSGRTKQSPDISQPVLETSPSLDKRPESQPDDQDVEPPVGESEDDGP